MLRLGQGWDYTLYKVYLVVGLAALMGGPVLLALIFGDRLTYADYAIPYMLALTGWIFGILLYWWWVFLIKDSWELQSRVFSSPDSIAPISALQNLSRLHQSMVIHGGEVEAGRKAYWQGKRPVLEFFGWLNLIVIWIFGTVWAGMLNLFPELDPVIVPVGVVVIALLLIIRLPFLVGRSTEGFAEVYLKPLGLDLTESPALKPQLSSLLSGGQAILPTGLAVLEGKRFDRSIRIELLDKNTRTMVQMVAPNFELYSPDGKFMTSDKAPEAVKQAVKALRKARRWKGVRVTGGSEGITIKRQSRRQNLWLYDLWLAEYLLEMTDGNQR